MCLEFPEYPEFLSLPEFLGDLACLEFLDDPEYPAFLEFPERLEYLEYLGIQQMHMRLHLKYLPQMLQYQEQ